MKKMLSLVLACALLLPLWGCKDNQPETVYAKPQFSPGTLYSDLLTAEEGNLDRANQTGNEHFLEIETGYYFFWRGCLYYAERTDASSWYYVCANPDCTHSTGLQNCSARS